MINVFESNNIRIAAYLAGLVWSFCIVVSMSLNINEFNGNCLLFANPALDEDKDKLIISSWSSPGYCHYIITIGVLMNIVCCFHVYKLSILHFRGSDSSLLYAFVEAITNTTMSLVILSAATMVTMGFVSWCEHILDSFVGCGDAAGLQVESDNSIDTNGFYTEMNVTEFAFWAAFPTFVGLSVLASLRMFHYHQDESMLEISFYNERQRLLTETGQPNVRSSNSSN